MTPESGGKLKEFSNTLTVSGMGEAVPAFAIADYVELSRPTVSLLHVPGHTSLARDYAVAAEANDPLLHDWLSEPEQPARVVELTDPNANPWQSGAITVSPLREAQPATLRRLLLPTQVAARFHSPHPWIQAGLERFLQTVSVDQRSGRKAALGFLDEYREPLIKAGRGNSLGQLQRRRPRNRIPKLRRLNNTLLNTTDELYLRGKGSFVFWMLRDMVGDRRPCKRRWPAIIREPIKTPAICSGC